MILQIAMLDKMQVYYRRRLSYLKFKRQNVFSSHYFSMWEEFHVNLEIATLEACIIYPYFPEFIRSLKSPKDL